MRHAAPRSYIFPQSTLHGNSHCYVNCGLGLAPLSPPTPHPPPDATPGAVCAGQRGCMRVTSGSSEPQANKRRRSVFVHITGRELRKYLLAEIFFFFLRQRPTPALPDKTPR
ncbi:hypothetical protein CHARACLAT_001933 [Characodon lateralis]|uniref:Uncharacterized protein n=1 Tax=Characodon lateralis TaxID=208331 RepID=A0ABU7EGX1_9TELE|nr:hypothetical protein [Characodon lateralis]